MKYYRNDNLFNDIKEQISLRTVMENEGIEFNNSGFCKCPFHEEKTASMSIKNNRYNCFGCAERGDVLDFIKNIRGYSSVTDAAKYLIESYNLNVSMGNYIVDHDEQKKAEEKRLRDLEKKEYRDSLISDFKSLYITVCELRQLLEEIKQNIDKSKKNIDQFNEREVVSLKHFTEIDSFSYYMLTMQWELNKIKNDNLLTTIQQGAKLCRKILKEMN